VIIATGIALTVNAAAQQRLHLAKLEFVGLRSLKNEQAAATSGLEIGQVVDTEALDVAAQKLVNSGLFKKVSYHLRAVKDQATVTFSVEESVRRMPVSFDNFVWMSETELYSAIRDDIPNFDGTVPANGEGGERIAASLRRLLKEKGVSGQVEFKTYSAEAGKQELMFAVKGPSLSICEVSFPGATVIPEEELLKTARPLLQMNYSRKDVGLFAANTLLPLYNHMGYLRARFSIPVATTQNTEQCKDGVAVTLSVDEGQQYSWGHAEWSGNKVLTPDQLNAAIGLKAGDLADDRLIDKGLHAASLAYGKKGYMGARWIEQTTFDDANKRVTYHFTVSEGPQFHMGQLTIAGLSEDDANKVKALWQLAPGAVFDQSYVEDFVSRLAPEFLSRHPVFSGVPLKISSDTKLNSANQTVDVTVTFK
jgi:outer membrane protein insertion porin family